MMRTRCVLVVAAVLALLSGCGDSGPVTLELSSKLRRFRAGDTWEYNFTGQWTPPNEPTIPVAGRMVFDVRKMELDGNDVLAEVQLFTLWEAEGAYEVIYCESTTQFFEQDEQTGNTYELATQGLDPDKPDKMRRPKSRYLISPGVWENGGTWNQKTSYDDGDEVEEKMTIEGSENAESPAASGQVWKMTTTSVSSKHGQIRSEMWYAPALGAPLRESISDTDPDGDTLTGTFVLVKTTVRP